MTQKYIMPTAAEPAVDDKGKLTTTFQRYLPGIEKLDERTVALDARVEEVEGRVQAEIAPLGGAATLADVINKVNAMIAAQQAAGQMES